MKDSKKSSKILNKSYIEKVLPPIASSSSRGNIEDEENSPLRRKDSQIARQAANLHEKEDKILYLESQIIILKEKHVDLIEIVK
jgi:hypothetical protein